MRTRHVVEPPREEPHRDQEASHTDTFTFTLARRIPRAGGSRRVLQELRRPTELVAGD